MTFPFKTRLAYSLAFVILCSSCFKVVPPATSRKEANEKFLKICREEYNLHLVTNAFKNTLWIYLPFKESIVDYKSTAEGPKHSDQPTKKWTINYLDGHF